MDWLIPQGLFAEHLIALIVALLVTGLVVVIHYEGVHALAARYAGRTPKRDRGIMLRVIFALLGLHVVEIWCYGLAYWGLTKVQGLGFLHGVHGADTLFDAVYLSATTYSTVGFGDLSPVGAVRVVSGLESLTGLLLITWSASFTYLEMSRLWSDGVPGRRQD
ncbi:potassium channel family protein [Agrilutibacter solisilvae]|uniref:Two pore domain potassium channel family protein n=1 Tax=Agrilutibacter solisilvae TaxID=2763317 RepID=A0A974XVZ1_9GAMM|nr:potassium channel family protein [Lysobacter solisilvae]QSX76922.1 two pore domain potassium channel family protein [Lysobacter solisilvae]